MTFPGNFIDKRVACIFIADLLVLHGVVFMGMDPCRMYAFYYLEFATFLISYSVYNVFADNRLEVGGIIISTLFMLFLMGFFIVMAMEILMPRNFDNVSDYTRLLYPYVDIPVYLISIIGAHTFNVKKYLSYETDGAKTEFSKLLMYNIFLIPALIFGSVIMLYLIDNIALSMILSLILLRNFIEYKRYSGLQKLNMLKEVQQGN